MTRFRLCLVQRKSSGCGVGIMLSVVLYPGVLLELSKHRLECIYKGLVAYGYIKVLAAF